MRIKSTRTNRTLEQCYYLEKMKEGCGRSCLGVLEILSVGVEEVTSCSEEGSIS